MMFNRFLGRRDDSELPDLSHYALLIDTGEIDIDRLLSDATENGMFEKSSLHDHGVERVVPIAVFTFLGALLLSGLVARGDRAFNTAADQDCSGVQAMAVRDGESYDNLIERARQKVAEQTSTLPSEQQVSDALVWNNPVWFFRVSNNGIIIDSDVDTIAIPVSCPTPQQS